MDVAELTDRAACLPTERLEAEITTLAGHLAAAECRWLLLVAEFDRREAWAHWGCVSASHWLGWKCGVEHRAALEKVRVARSLRGLPSITDAFAKGEVSYSQVRALTRVAEPSTEADLLALARHATAAQLERLVRGYRRVCRDEDETAAANHRHDRRYLSWFWDDDGSLVIHGRLDPEDGALLLGVLRAEEARSAERTDVDPVNRTADRPADARRADALVAVAERATYAGPGSGATAELAIHVDAEVLPHGGPGRCQIEDGPALAPETARRLSCDATLVAVVEGLDGTPIDVGRRTRKISARLRRAVLARDGQCLFPGCHRAGTDIHHRVPWHAGGRTDLDNLDALCRFHHRLVHEGGWSIERVDPGAVRFTRPDGTVLAPGPTPAGACTGDVEGANATAGVTVTSTTIQSEWRGDPLDLGWAVGDLCRSRESGRPSDN
jgi:hypothetical protein